MEPRGVIFVLVQIAIMAACYSFIEENSCPCGGRNKLVPVYGSDGKTYWSEECAKCMNPGVVITRKWFCPRLDIELEG